MNSGIQETLQKRDPVVFLTEGSTDMMQDVCNELTDLREVYAYFPPPPSSFLASCVVASVCLGLLASKPNDEVTMPVITQLSHSSQVHVFVVLFTFGSTSNAT